MRKGVLYLKDILADKCCRYFTGEINRGMKLTS
jgi:hypothetical protein